MRFPYTTTGVNYAGVLFMFPDKDEITTRFTKKGAALQGRLQTSGSAKSVRDLSASGAAQRSNAKLLVLPYFLYVKHL